MQRDGSLPQPTVFDVAGAYVGFRVFKAVRSALPPVLRAADSGAGAGGAAAGPRADCPTCKGSGVCACDVCKGTGRDKKGGNIFERWKCMKCQGFGSVGCPECKQGGLTPEQRGER
eukprot:tig00000197_g15697.t1